MAESEMESEMESEPALPKVHLAVDFDFHDPKTYSHAIVRQIEPGVPAPFSCLHKDTLVTAGVSEEAFGSKPVSMSVRQRQYFVIGPSAYVFYCKVEQGTSSKKRKTAVDVLNKENVEMEPNSYAQDILPYGYPGRLLKNVPYLPYLQTDDEYSLQERVHQPTADLDKGDLSCRCYVPDDFLDDILEREQVPLETVLRESDREPSSSEEETGPEAKERNQNRRTRREKYTRLRSAQRKSRREERDEVERETQMSAKVEKFIQWRPSVKKPKRGRPPKATRRIDGVSQLYRPDQGNELPEDWQDNTVVGDVQAPRTGHRDDVSSSVSTRT